MNGERRTKGNAERQTGTQNDKRGVSVRIRAPVAKSPKKVPAKSAADKAKPTEEYRHKTDTSPMRPDVGTQAQFRKKKAPQTYRYDSSLSPALDWDGQHGAR